MLRTDYSHFYPVSGEVMNRTNEAINDVLNGGGVGGGDSSVYSVNGQTGDVTITPADIGAATAEQGGKADTAVQPSALSSYVPTSRTIAGKSLSSNITLAKGDVGLGNVDNTSDASKPISTATQFALDSKADSVHSHEIAEVSGLQTALSTKAGIVHTHTADQIEDLQSVLSVKADSGHSHTVGDVAGLQSTLDGKAATAHTHAIGDVSNLQTALDGKAATGHTHSIANVTGLQAALDGKLTVPAPPETGTFVLKSVDGVVSWVEEAE